MRRIHKKNGKIFIVEYDAILILDQNYFIKLKQPK